MLFHSSCICSLCNPPPLLALHGDLEDARKAREDADRISLRSAEVWTSVGECSMTLLLPRKRDQWQGVSQKYHEQIMMICLHALGIDSILLVSTWVVSLSGTRQGFSKGSSGSRAAVGAGHTPSRGRTRDKKWDSYRVKKKLKTCAFSYYLMLILILWKSME